MTEQYLRNITPDYITGAVSACEGIKDSMVLINGPLGCKFFHGYASGQSVMKSPELWGLRGELRLRDAMDDHLVRSQYFAGTPQVPGTNLRYEDFIFGTVEQLRRALNDILAERSYSLITVIQAPGTSLLAETLEPELEEMAAESGTPCFFVESPVFSENLFLGYDETMAGLLERFARAPETDTAEVRRTGEATEKNGRPSVNLFGFYTYEKYLEGDLEEIRRLLDLCGIDVHCAAGANCTMESLRSIHAADAHICFSAERCTKTAAWLKRHSDRPILDLGFMPVGPDLTERLVRTISSLLGTDCGPALEEIERVRARIFYYIARFTGGKGFPRDFRYAAEGEASMLYAMTDYLSGYLGIEPEALHVLFRPREGGGDRKLTELLEELGCGQALKRDITEAKDVVLFGSANAIARSLAYSGNVFGVETMFPSSGYIHVVPKTMVGASGALYLLEQVMNGLRMLRAWD